MPHVIEMSILSMHRMCLHLHSTSMLIPGDVDPRISTDNNKFGDFIHFHGGKLYTVNITGHMLYVVLILPNWLKPSLAKPSLTLRDH
jgi:hypothetical protein